MDWEGNPKRNFRFPSIPPGHVVDVKIFEDQSFIVCMTSTFNYNMTYLFKSDAFGNVQWLKEIGSEQNYSKWGNRVQFLNDGGCYIISSYDEDSKGLADIPDTTYGNSDMLVYRIDSAGTILWAKNFGSSGYDSSLEDLSGLDENENLILSGMITQNNLLFFDHDIEDAKYNDLFRFTISKTGELIDKAYYPPLDSDTNLVLVQHSISPKTILNKNRIEYFAQVKWNKYKPANYPTPDTGSADACIVSLSLIDSTYQYYPFGGSGYDEIEDFTVLDNGNIVAIGRTLSKEWDNDNSVKNSDPWIVMLNDKKEVLYSQSFFHSENENHRESFSNITHIGGNKVIVQGRPVGTSLYTWLNGFDFDLLPTSVWENKSNNQVRVFPNPVVKGTHLQIAGASEKIKVQLFTSQGKQVAGTLNTTNGYIATQHLAKGVYSMVVFGKNTNKTLYQGQIVIQ